jgi:hypothetical protein
LERTLEKVAIDRAWIIERLKSNVERCRQAEAVTDRQGKATGEYRFDVTGANKALELLGRSIGLFVEREEPSNEGLIAEEERRRLAEERRLKALSDDELDTLEMLCKKMDAAMEKPRGVSGDGSNHPSCENGIEQNAQL